MSTFAFDGKTFTDRQVDALQILASGEVEIIAGTKDIRRDVSWRLFEKRLIMADSEEMGAHWKLTEAGERFMRRFSLPTFRPSDSTTTSYD
jgi:hypothetical protein